jgi:hypothetical protein
MEDLLPQSSAVYHPYDMPNFESSTMNIGLQLKFELQIKGTLSPAVFSSTALDTTSNMLLNSSNE